LPPESQSNYLRCYRIASKIPSIKLWSQSNYYKMLMLMKNLCSSARLNRLRMAQLWAKRSLDEIETIFQHCQFKIFLLPLLYLCERETASKWVCMLERESVRVCERESASKWVCMWERECVRERLQVSEFVCVWDNERERDSTSKCECVCARVWETVCVCVCVCVCVSACVSCKNH